MPGKDSHPFRHIPKPARFGVKLALFAGFGGLLVLMALAGLDFIRALRQIQTNEAQITQTYLKRHRLLEQIRSSLYLSSTLVRDYLLESNPEAARASMAGLHSLRDEMTAALREYSKALRPDEAKPFSDLKSEIYGYWNTLEPVFQWSPEERRSQGSRYLQSQVFPRRALMIGIADKIDSFNEQALSSGGQRAAELFSGLRQRVIAILGLTLGIGSILAAASIMHILRMEQEGRLRYDEIQGAQQELKRLSARLVEAQEQERRAISRELHDQVGPISQRPPSGSGQPGGDHASRQSGSSPVSLYRSGSRRRKHKGTAEHGPFAEAIDARRFGSGCSHGLAGTRGFPADGHPGRPDCA